MTQSLVDLVISVPTKKEEAQPVLLPWRHSRATVYRSAIYSLVRVAPSHLRTWALANHCADALLADSRFWMRSGRCAGTSNIRHECVSGGAAGG